MTCDADEREWRAGYGWLLRRARECHGDLFLVRAVRPPKDQPREWRSGFDAARLDLTDLLLPVGVDLERHLAEYVPRVADAQAVEAFADGAASVSTIRAGLFGEAS